MSAGERRGTHVLLVQPFDDGGIAHYTHSLAEALAAAGLAVTLYTSANYELGPRAAGHAVRPRLFRLAGRLTRAHPWLGRETGLPCALRRALKLLEYPLNTLELLRFARRAGVDLAHFQTVNLTEMVPAALLKAAGARVVYTVHNVAPRHGAIRAHDRVLHRLLYGLCDRVISHTQQGRSALVAEYGVDAGRIAVVPMGDFKLFLGPGAASREEARAALGLDPGDRVLLFFGAIRPNKGLDLLLRALPKVRAAVPEARLLIAGEPCEDYARYAALIEQGGVRDAVRELLEYVPNERVQLPFAAADVVVLPYREVTQSAVLQVAYAFAKPVVATAVGGFPESIEDRGNGLLVPPEDPEALADSLAALLRDPDAMAAMGRRSRELADTRASWEEVARRTGELYAACGCRGAGDGPA